MNITHDLRMVQTAPKYPERGKKTLLYNPDWKEKTVRGFKFQILEHGKNGL